MEFQLSGKLKSETSKQPNSTGCRIEALFDRKAALTPSRVSASSDAAGNFTLVFPDQHEIASKTVKFVVSSPAGRIIREMEVMTADLCDAITIEVEAFEAGPFDNPASQPKTPQRAAVDALFQNEASLRHAIRENLTTLRPESDAIAKRVQDAFAAFNPSNLSEEELARRHYVAPGADPYETLEAVAIKGTDAIRSSHITPTIVLRNSAELKRLIKENSEPTASLRGVVELGPLIDFISSKSRGSSLVTEPTYTLCKAELQADKILDVVENPPMRGNGDDAANPEDSSPATREADQFVKDHVNRQMKSATAPESQLAYRKIPNSADQDKVQSGILQRFQLRPGASDVTSYHDFHTLQIAFEHVWTEIFDGKLASFGRDLYGEYVKLKDFSGSGQPDLQISTLADLRRLMEEIKKLSRIVEDDIPDDLRGGAGDSKDDSPKNSGGLSLDDVGRGALAGATGGLSLLFELALNEIRKAGTKPLLTWDSFRGPLPRNPPDTIEVSFEYDAFPLPEMVSIVLVTDEGSHWKGIEFQSLEPTTNRTIPGPSISNAGNNYRVSFPPFHISQLKYGVLQFSSEETTGHNLGRYLLANLTERLKSQTRVTFYWKGQK